MKKKPGAGELMPLLYTIEVHFNYKGERMRWLIENQTGEEVMNVRLTILQSGFNYQKTPTHSEIIFPKNLLEIWIDIQKHWAD